MKSSLGGTHLLGIDNIHDNTTLQHLSQTGLDGEVVGSSPVGGTILVRRHGLREQEK